MSDQPRDITAAELGALGLAAAVLCVVLFTPLVPALDVSGPAQAKLAAEDAVRSTASQLRREITTAAGVIEPESRALNLRVSSIHGEQIVRIDDAVLDLVPPSPRKRPAREKAGTVEMRLSGVEQPLAPEMIVVRFFAGLRYPVNPQAVPGRPEANEPQPYVNRYAGVPENLVESYVARHGVNNPYLLYRVNFSPYRLKEKGEPGYQGPKHPAYTVNEQLFATDADGRPVMDDPDFFRVVTQSDTDPHTGRSYTATDITAHNARVCHWVNLAKPVLSDLDLDVLKPEKSGREALSIRFTPSIPTDTPPLIPGRLLFATQGAVQVDLGLRVYDDKSGLGETARRTERMVIGSDRPRA